MAAKAKSRKQLLQEAIKAGATFGEFIELYAEKNTERDLRMIEKARYQHHSEGSVEIDDTTICSGTDEDAGGEYVLAWVWVDAP